MANIAGAFALSTNFGSLQAAVDSDAGVLYIPPGSHSAGTGVRITKSKIIFGAGKEQQTTITTTGAFAISIECDLVTLDDLLCSGRLDIRGRGHCLRNIQPAGGMKDTGVISDTFILQPHAFSVTTGKLIDFGAFDHRNVVVEAAYQLGPTGLPGHGTYAVTLRGHGNIISGGAGDGLHEDFWRYRVLGGSCVLHGMDYEAGYGGFCVVEAGGVALINGGVEYNPNSVSTPPPSFRAIGGSDMRVIALESADNNFTDWASTDGSSYIEFIGCRTTARIGTSNYTTIGNVYNHQSGSFG